MGAGSQKRRIGKTIWIFLILLIISLTPMEVTIGHGIKLQESTVVAGVGDIGLIIGGDHFDVEYDESQGNLKLKLSNLGLLNLGLLDSVYYVFYLPQELKYILQDKTLFEQNSEDNIHLNLGTKNYILDSESGMIAVRVTSLLNIDLLGDIFELTIDLEGLSAKRYLANKSGTMVFYGATVKNNIVQLDIIKVDSDSNHTDELEVPSSIPTINTVTDRDTVVTGSGIAGNEILLNITGEKVKVGADNTFKFIVPQQKAGTEIIATQIFAEDWIESASTTVIGVILEFSVPELLQFQPTERVLTEITIPRADLNWKIVIRDTRAVGSQWRLKAIAEGPLTTLDGHQLDPNALIYKKAGLVQSLCEEVSIYEGVKGESEETVINWQEDEGILLRLNPIDTLPDVEYSTTIHWTLESAP